jgi:hypothetical protein
MNRIQSLLFCCTLANIFTGLLVSTAVLMLSSPCVISSDQLLALNVPNLWKNRQWMVWSSVVESLRLKFPSYSVWEQKLREPTISWKSVNTMINLEFLASVYHCHWLLDHIGFAGRAMAFYIVFFTLLYYYLFFCCCLRAHQHQWSLGPTLDVDPF